MSMLPYGVSIWLFLIGLYGVATSRHLIHLIVCLSVAQSSTYILLLAIGYRHGAGPPIFLRAPVGTPAVDPVVQALALTDVVVSAAVTALLLAVAIRIHKRTGTLDPQALRPLRN
ncbi:MAG TPA: cation:proton antiporter subunit C [Nitrospiraceae bacterium]|nr:cation:proton antiporter subunit C [Nitrospiraceae bacterium]